MLRRTVHFAPVTIQQSRTVWSPLSTPWLPHEASAVSEHLHPLPARRMKARLGGTPWVRTPLTASMRADSMWLSRSLLVHRTQRFLKAPAAASAASGTAMHCSSLCIAASKGASGDLHNNHAVSPSRVMHHSGCCQHKRINLPASSVIARVTGCNCILLLRRK